jgi:copper resistance protein C
MKQPVCFALFLMHLSFSQMLPAHAVVTDHSLKIAAIPANEAKQVVLTFNSKVEIGLSEIFLVSKGDKHTPLKLSKGLKQGDVAVSLPALNQGEYALRYRIFASDGHLTEDVIRFSVTP